MMKRRNEGKGVKRRKEKGKQREINDKKEEEIR